MQIFGFLFCLTNLHSCVFFSLKSVLHSNYISIIHGFFLSLATNATTKLSSVIFGFMAAKCMTILKINGKQDQVHPFWLQIIIFFLSRLNVFLEFCKKKSGIFSCWKDEFWHRIGHWNRIVIFANCVIKIKWNEESRKIAGKRWIDDNFLKVRKCNSI